MVCGLSQHDSVCLCPLLGLHAHQIEAGGQVGGHHGAAAADGCGLHGAARHVEEGDGSLVDVFAHGHVHHAIGSEHVRADLACNVCSDAHGQRPKCSANRVGMSPATEVKSYVGVRVQMLEVVQGPVLQPHLFAERDAVGVEAVAACGRQFHPEADHGAGLGAVEAVDDQTVGAHRGVELRNVGGPHLVAVKIIGTVLCRGVELQYQLFNLNTGRLDAALKRKDLLPKGLKDHGRNIADGYQMVLRYNAGVMYMMNDEPRAAKKLFNEIRELKHITECRDLQGLARLFRLLLLMMDNEADFYSYMRNSRPFFADTHRQYPLEQMVYAWIGAHCKLTSEAHVRSSFAQLTAKVLPFEKEKMTGAEELRIWAQAHANGQPVREVYLAHHAGALASPQPA
jgi:hypothetical protein